MSDKITASYVDELKKKFFSRLKNIDSLSELDKLSFEYLSKKSILSSTFKSLLSLDLESRKSLGIKLNDLKKDIISNISAKRDTFKQSILLEQLEQSYIDVTAPSMLDDFGTMHILTRTIYDIRFILSQLGFSESCGPDIDNEYYVFDALNTPRNHPARQMQDTFYMQGGKVLRTHTSSVQIRTMEKKELPLNIFSIGKVYRNDWDITHTPMFHQLETLYVDKNVNVAQLKYFVIKFLNIFFEGKNIKFRFRPSFFPFTEPSMEVDVLFDDIDSKFHGKWLEIMGCGMVHKNVFQSVGIDHQQYKGFAFGVGIERLAMIKYGIYDLRDFYASNINWLLHYRNA